MTSLVVVHETTKFFSPHTLLFFPHYASQIGKDGTIRTDLDTLFVITCFYIYIYIYIYVFVFIVCILHFCAVRLVVLFLPFLSVTINVIVVAFG